MCSGIATDQCSWVGQNVAVISLVYGCLGRDAGHGGMVVVAPMGTKPLLGGSKSTVPAGTLSGFLMLLSSTKAGADKLKRSAMRYKVSPDCTVYFWGTPVVVGAPVEVVAIGSDVVGPDCDALPPPSVSSPEMIARNANSPVLHTR